MSVAEGLRWLRAHVHEWSGANRRARERLDGSRAVVLAYHRFLPHAEAERSSVEPGMYVTPETFAAQLEWLDEHFRVLPLHEVVTRLAEGRTLPPGACALTFDDGWRDNLEHAVPALERRGLPATLFAVAQRVGTEGAFWPDEVCERMASLPAPERGRLAERLGAAPGRSARDALLAHLKRVPEAARGDLLEELRSVTPAPPQTNRALLDWEELDRCAAAGIDVESHGATHAILTGIPDDEVERELQTARVELRERGHGRRELLAYPSGAHDARVDGIAQRVGYRAAFTTAEGLVDADADPMALPRLGVHVGIGRNRADFLFRVPGTP